MSQTEAPPAGDSAARSRRKQLKRRAKRGIVATYIHEISRRHNDAVRAKPAPEVALAEPAQAQELPA
jgi:hypothetical protein